MWRKPAIFLALAAALVACDGASSDARPAPPNTTPPAETSTPAATTMPSAAADAASVSAPTDALEARCKDGDGVACEDYGDALLKRDPPVLVTAFEAYQTGCEVGHAASCTAQGRLTQDGRGVGRDAKSAMRLYQKACEAGDGSGCLNAGLMLNGGIGMDIDVAQANVLFGKARDAFQAACDRSDWAYCLNLGVIYETGYGIGEPNLHDATAVYAKACEGGAQDACFNQVMLEQQGMGSQKAVRDRLEVICATGESGLSCRALGGLLIESGEVERGRELLEASCREGIEQACGTLGGYLAMGGALTQDMPRSKALQQRACDLGDALACFILGVWPLQDAESRSYGVSPLTRACHMGHAEACATLGLLYEQGQVVERDPLYARGLYSDACRMGYPGACVELIEKSEPLPLPPDRRAFMLEGACARKIENACTLLEFERTGKPPEAPKQP